MPSSAPPLITALVLASLTGCGSSVVVAGSGGQTSTTGTGTTSGTITGGACPAVEPTGGSCAGYPAGFRCTYGSDTRPECRDEWICDAGAWVTSNGVCAMSTACGTAQPTAGTDCPADGAVCAYGQTICICSQCPNGPCMQPPAKWTCAGPPAGAGCPPVAPNTGTSCAGVPEGTMCSYGFVCSGAGALATCTGGLWTWDDMVACLD